MAESINVFIIIIIIIINVWMVNVQVVLCSTSGVELGDQNDD